MYDSVKLFRSTERLAEGEKKMGGSIHDKKQQIDYLRNRLSLLLTSLESMDPEDVEAAEMQRFIDMLEQVEMKATTFKKEWERG